MFIYVTKLINNNWVCWVYLQRFNVAITRPKALLIIVGNPFVLIKDKHWAKYVSPSPFLFNWQPQNGSGPRRAFKEPPGARPNVHHILIFCNVGKMVLCCWCVCVFYQCLDWENFIFYSKQFTKIIYDSSKLKVWTLILENFFFFTFLKKALWPGYFLL